jgi:hypothetical protein
MHVYGVNALGVLPCLSFLEELAQQKVSYIWRFLFFEQAGIQDSQSHCGVLYFEEFHMT